MYLVHNLISAGQGLDFCVRPGMFEECVNIMSREYHRLENESAG